MRAVLALLVSLVLAACVPGGGPVEEGAISEQVLPQPGDAGQAPDETGGPARGTPEQDTPAQDTPTQDNPATQASPEPASAPQASDPPILARQRAACADQGGQLMPRGTGFFACVQQTRDGGQRCNAAADCQGLCLARSGTCAPLHPLFGCHEVFTLPGRRETLCTD